MNDAEGRPFGSASFDDADVSRGLRELPRQVSMPQDVSIRIAAAIEAEARAARERGTLEEPATPDGGRREAAAAPRGWFRRRAPQLLAGAAGLGILTFGLYLAGSGMPGGGADSATSADSAGESMDSGAAAAPEAATGEQDDGASFDPDRDATADEDVELFLSATELSALVSTVASTGSEVEPGCGRGYADEIDATLLGSAEIDGGVLVVTTFEGTASVEGWTLGWCDAAYPVEDADPVVVARPTP